MNTEGNIINIRNWMTINDFMNCECIKSRKTIYNMIEDGRLKKKKVLDRTLVKWA